MCQEAIVVKDILNVRNIVEDTYDSVCQIVCEQGETLIFCRQPDCNKPAAQYKFKQG